MAPQPICPCRRSTVAASAATNPEKRPTRQARGATSLVLPGIGLVLVPKCPMCIAAWLAVGSGFSIPLTTAAHLRTAFVWLCWGALLVLVLRLLARLVSRPGAQPARR